MANPTVPDKWHIPRWMRIAGIALGMLVLVILILLIAGKGEVVEDAGTWIWEGLQSIWLWIVGLAGGILALFQRDGNKGIREAKKEIKAENDRIGLELDGLRDSMSRIDEWRERERALHEREIQLLERELSLKEQKLQALESKIDTLSDMSGQEFFESLSEAKQREIRALMDNRGSGFD